VTDALPPLPADRHIALEGSVNFRDLGGYEGLDGRSTKWGYLFRADGLSHLTEADHKILQALNVATVIDLRTNEEIERDRFDLEATPVTYHHAPLIQRTSNPQDFEAAPFLLRDTYVTMLTKATSQIRLAVEVIADQENHPVVFHCAAGKDRTGVLAALLLGLVGVSPETIVADYALTARAMERLREKILARNPELRERMGENVTEVMSAAPENMERFLAVVEERHGSIEAYAKSIGIADHTIEALREGFLEAPAR
jgi:protein-tyrosine phosphatase